MTDAERAELVATLPAYHGQVELAVQAAERAAAERERADAERVRAEKLERELADARAEIERLERR